MSPQGSGTRSGTCSVLHIFYKKNGVVQKNAASKNGILLRTLVVQEMVFCLVHISSTILLVTLSKRYGCGCTLSTIKTPLFLIVFL